MIDDNEGFEYERCMVLSTGHVPEDVMEGLTDGSLCPCISYDEGVVLSTEPRSNIPPELAYVLGYAAARGASLIRFDADGPEVDLPSWDW